MEVVLLGTGAPLCPGRAGLGLLLRAEGLPPLLLDTCGGLELADRLYRVGQPIEDLRHVIVTHSHGDHMAGAMALALARVPCTYYGLPHTLSAIQALIHLTYGEYDLNPQTVYTPIEAGQTYRIAGYEVGFFAMPHRVPTVAVRVRAGHSVVAYSADGLTCAALAECADGADLLLCDALCASSDLEPARLQFLMHPNARQAAELAQQAGVRALALVHLARFANPQQMLKEARQHYPGPVSIPDDGQVFVV